MRFAGVILLLAVSLSAQDKRTHTTFTPSSAVIREDDNTWYIGAEAVLAPPASGNWLTDADLNFTLPPNGTITAIEGSVSFASPWGPTSIVGAALRIPVQGACYPLELQTLVGRCAEAVDQTASAS